MIDHYPIAIVGGGLGGLTAARVLHCHGIESAVFELEPDRHSRVQGGMLDIHEDNGQQAIRVADLWDEFAAIIHPGGEAMRILDHTGEVLRDEPDEDQRSRPEVNRGDLLDLLIDSLPAGTIRWGHRVTSVQPDPTSPGRHAIDLDDGQTVTTDLLIGADGAWSKIRPLVSDAWPIYSGVSFVEARLPNALAQHPVEAAAVGGGMWFAFRGATGFIGHAETDGSLHAYLGFRVPEDWIDTIDFTDEAASKQTILDLLDGWSEPLRGLIANADHPLTPRRIHALPVGHRWERTPGVTLLGDAAHLMSPFAGEGANLAMYDAAQLALAIARHTDDVEAALCEYESDLFPRAEVAARESAESLQMLYRDTSPQPLLQMFSEIDELAANEGSPR